MSSTSQGKRKSSTRSEIGSKSSPLPREALPVIGNDKIIARLLRAVEHGLDSHAVLLVGPRGIGKTSLALSLTAALLCHRPENGIACGDCASCAALAYDRHPDFFTVPGTGAYVGIEDIRSVLRLVVHRPVLGTKKIALIDRAERMTEEAANAFLKTLEEPSHETVVVLTASHIQLLPETLVSRCSVYNLTVMSERGLRDHLLSKGIPRAEASNLAGFCDGRPAYALFLLQQPAVYEEAIEDSSYLLELLSARLHERLRITSMLAERATTAQHSESIIERWESLLRRMLKIKIGIPDRGPLSSQLRSVAPRLTLRHLLDMARELTSARQGIRSSGNLRLALESFALHLPIVP